MYIVDDAPFSGSLNDINPNDIKSVTVLKDASTTSLYGARGANGVIVITTKRGKTDKLKLDFVANAGISLPTALQDMLNNDEFLQLYQEALEND